MTLWIIEARDPLIFGDGKPFTAIPGTRAKSLDFPYPATVTGSIRTRVGLRTGGQFDEAHISELLNIEVRGPLLVEMAENGCIRSWLFPAPADALLLKSSDPNLAQRLWVRPVRLPAGTATNLEGLALVGPSKAIQGKPLSRPPLYWQWEAYVRWLRSPGNDLISVGKLGHHGPTRESRVHVSIKSDVQTALEGALFQTSGMEFMYVRNQANEGALSGVQMLALAVETDARLEEGPDFLGGERRIVFWQKTVDRLPACPDEVRREIVQRRACRVFLVTPACFDRGFFPTWLLTCIPDVQATVVGAAVQRYQTISGWDYRQRRPKPTRRMAPAGSVYFLTLSGNDDAIGRFVDTVWMHSISDQAQARLDGFGMAVLGVWDGMLQEMEV